MSTMSQNHAGCPIASRISYLDEEMAELSLFLPAEQVAQMESLASSRNMTLGQLIRLLVRNYLSDRTATGLVSNRPMGSLAIPRRDRFDSQAASP
jgi:hypothetical protein